MPILLKNRYRTLLIALQVFVIIGNLCLLPIDAAGANNIPQQKGNLEQYLKAIDYGKKADHSWVDPSARHLEKFSGVMEAFVRSNFNRAHRLSGKIGYRVIEFVDTSRSPERSHYILQELDALGSSSYKGAGIFVAKTTGKPIAIEAPHPQSDLYTELQAIELYMQSPAQYLFIAGSRRNSSTASSACSGSFFTSDAVHNTQHTFYVAHQALAESNPETLFLQLHGFGSSSLDKLQTQCQTNNDKLINLSPGKKYFPDGQATNFIDVLSASINQAGQSEACVYGSNTRSLGGTTNTTGRFSNHSADACTENATEISHQFIHIEQSFPVRASYRSLVNDQILDAIESFYGL